MISEKKPNRKEDTDNDEPDRKRRKFIKGMLGGAAALGTASLMPTAAALDIRDSHGFQVFDDTNTEYLDVNPGGPVEVKNADLNVTTGYINGKHLTSTNSVTSNYTTSGEQVIFADTSSGSLTVTLASADLLDGNEIVIADSGGSASTNSITVNTESGETIDGQSSIEINSEYGAQRISSDGSNWYTSGGGSRSKITEKLYTRDPRR